MTTRTKRALGAVVALLVIGGIVAANVIREKRSRVEVETGKVETFDLTMRNGIASFLEVNELVEPVIKAGGVDGAVEIQGVACGVVGFEKDHADGRRAGRLHPGRPRADLALPFPL